jgi:hypothetical protein
MLGVLAVNLTARHRERLPAWPGSARAAWILAAVVLTAIAVWAVTTAARGRAFPYVALGAAVVVAVLLAVWPLERHARSNWYVDAGLPLDAVNAALHDERDTHIAFFGTTESYPFYGRDLSNRVTRPAGPGPDATGAQCREWVTRLRGFTYVVVAHQPFAYEGPPDEFFAPEPGAVRVAGDGEGGVYRLDAPLTGAAC